MKKVLLYVLKAIFWVYLKTLRIQIAGKKRIEETLEKTPCIFLLWHDSLFLTPALTWLGKTRPVHVLISNSRDGNIPSEFATLYKNFSVLRVRHLARPQALMECCSLLKAGKSLLITPDGPRGPRRKMKDGAIYAAMKASVPLVPIVWEASHFISLPTWDKFRIPLPLSKVSLTFLPPHMCEKGVSLEECKAALDPTFFDT